MNKKKKIKNKEELDKAMKVIEKTIKEVRLDWKKRNLTLCEWCGDLVNKDELEEAGGCDIIPKGYKVCKKCINIPKGG
jgi:hypothetical protein